MLCFVFKIISIISHCLSHQIEASDGSMSGNTTVQIHILDANDNPPVFVHSSYSCNVSEVNTVHFVCALGIGGWGYLCMRRFKDLLSQKDHQSTSAIHPSFNYSPVITSARWPGDSGSYRRGYTGRWTTHIQSQSGGPSRYVLNSVNILPYP